jgi:hypothetical protein
VFVGLTPFGVGVGDAAPGDQAVAAAHRRSGEAALTTTEPAGCSGSDPDEAPDNR